MDNGERIKFLEYVYHAHFSSSSDGNEKLANRYAIEEYIERDLNEEEREMVERAYENGRGDGFHEGMRKALQS